jgi:hypothetical protein
MVIIMNKPANTLIVFGFLKPAGVHGNTNAEPHQVFPQVGLFISPVAYF